MVGKGRKGTGTHVLILMDGNQTPLPAIIAPANNHETRQIERLLGSSVRNYLQRLDFRKIVFDRLSPSPPENHWI